MERKRKTQSHFLPQKMWQGTMVDVCDTFCGVETFAAALEMDQMDQMNQSALEPQKKWLNMLGVAGPSYIVFDPGEWFRFIGCRYGQPRIWYQPSKMGIGNWKPPYIPIWCLHHHPVQARPPYLISPYLSQNLAPQPSVIPTVLLVGIRKKWINMTIESVWSVWSQP